MIDQPPPVYEPSDTEVSTWERLSSAEREHFLFRVALQRVTAQPSTPELPERERTDDMGLILLALLLVLIFAGAGFALHVLWIVAVVLLLIWLLGFLVSGVEHSWYRVQKK